MRRSTFVAIAFTSASVALACGSTIDVGKNQSDGGAQATGDGAAAGAPLSPAAMASQYLAKCKVACAPPSSGPCKSADLNACIESCTGFTEGLVVGCAQCVIEHSEYTGVTCTPSPCGTRCPPVFCDYPNCALSSCGGAAGQPPPPCDPACTPSDEKCNGFRLAKTTDSECTSLCK